MTTEIDLNHVIDLDKRAASLGISYEQGSIYEKEFQEFKRVVEGIREWEEKFGNYGKVIRTLEENQDRLEALREECERLTGVL